MRTITMKKMLILLIVSLIPLKSFATSNPSLEQDIGYCYGLLIIFDKANAQAATVNNGAALKEINAIFLLKLAEIDGGNTAFLAQNYMNTLSNVAKNSENSSDAGYQRLSKIGWNSCVKLGISGFRYVE